MSVTEKHVYNVEGFGQWLAKDAAQERRAALLGVNAKRLTGGEIIALPKDAAQERRAALLGVNAKRLTGGEIIALPPGSINDAETTLARADQPDLPPTPAAE